MAGKHCKMSPQSPNFLIRNLGRNNNTTLARTTPKTNELQRTLKELSAIVFAMINIIVILILWGNGFAYEFASIYF